MEMDRIRKIEDALKTKDMKKQMHEWENQKNFLRETLRELWMDGTGFKTWWKSSPEQVKMALVLTAIDDFPSSPAFGIVVFAVCEELLNEEELVKNEGEKLTLLLEKLINETENSEMISQTENVSFSASVKSALTTARSCILLQFATAILLIFQNENGPQFTK